jgi:membrane associated rhomboid family serine protease
MGELPDQLWVRFGHGQPVKISHANCQDVADLIEAVRIKLNLSERLDELYLFVTDADGFKGKQQRVGKSLTLVMQEHPWAGRDDEHPLVIRAIQNGPTEQQPSQRPPLWDVDLMHIKAILTLEWNSLNWFTIAFVLHSILLGLEPFSVTSVTFLFIVLKVLVYIALYENQTLEERHFTCSSGNLAGERYWTLITSSLAHADINHLLCNIFALLNGGPVLESILGFKLTFLFFCLASVASSLISLKVHGQPSIGSSAVIYAIDGFLIQVFAFDWKSYVIDQILFYLATQDERIDHSAHLGGFFFGYIMRDLYRYFFNR